MQTQKPNIQGLLVKLPLSTKIPRKNREDNELIKATPNTKSVLVDYSVYEELTNNEYFTKIELISHLREHSGGYAVFQKAWKKADGSFKIETIYLHKYIAEKYIPFPEELKGQKVVVNLKNGDRLDCRLENLEWVTMSMAARRSRCSSKTGYRGVYKEKKGGYRSTIYINKVRVHLGMFPTALEAAEAYNKRSLEEFGELPRLKKPNVTPTPAMVPRKKLGKV